MHATTLVFDAGATLASRTRPDAIQLDPLFGPRSRARSRWIALGAVGETNPVEFLTDHYRYRRGVVVDYSPFTRKQNEAGPVCTTV